MISDIRDKYASDSPSDDSEYGDGGSVGSNFDVKDDLSDNKSIQDKVRMDALRLLTMAEMSNNKKTIFSRMNPSVSKAAVQVMSQDEFSDGSTASLEDTTSFPTSVQVRNGSASVLSGWNASETQSLCVLEEDVIYENEDSKTLQSRVNSGSSLHRWASTGSTGKSIETNRSSNDVLQREVYLNDEKVRLPNESKNEELDMLVEDVGSESRRKTLSNKSWTWIRNKINSNEDNISETKKKSPKTMDEEDISEPRRKVSLANFWTNVDNDGVGINESINALIKDDTLISMEDQKKEDRIERKLPQDVFSILMLTPRLFTVSTIFAVTALFFQTFAIGLMLKSRTSFEKSFNSWNFPSGVEWTTHATQFVALVMAVFAQNDFIISLTQLFEGFHNLNLAIGSAGMSFMKWALTIALRFLTSCLTILVTWLLIVQGKTVFEVIENFLVISLTSFVNRALFIAASRGFVGAELQASSWYIESNVFHMKKSYENFFQRRLSILSLLLLSYLSAWGWLCHVQNTGQYLHRSFAVQFGDDLSSPLGTFSGVYDLQTSESYGGRLYYKERKWGFTAFTYCWKDNVWTLSYSDSKSDFNPCANNAASSKTDTFDIMESFSKPWDMALKNQGRDRTILQHLWTKSLDCRMDQDVCGIHGTCAHDKRNRGDGDTSACLCDEGWYGVQCNFKIPCQNIEIDQRKDGFLGTRVWSKQYHSLKLNKESPAFLYDRPIYVSKVGSQYDIILFIGRRWVLTSSESLPIFQSTNNPNVDTKSTLTEETLADYLTNTFHPFGSIWVGRFISEPIDIETSKDTAAPIDVKWYYAKEKNIANFLSADQATAIQASLICSICNERTNPCLHDGVCQTDGSCKCKTGGKGTLCQVLPLGNGICNGYFNTPAFHYDGGDCCRETCNSSEYSCGSKWNSNTQSLEYSGFPDCRDPTQVCQSCWDQYTKSFLSEPTFRDRYSLKTNSDAGKYMYLSEDGKTLAVSDGASSQSVQVYSLDGREWSKKGNSIQSNAKSSYFGDSLSLSGDGQIVAIGGKKHSGGRGMVRVYQWKVNQWDQMGNTLLGHKVNSFFGGSISLSFNGHILAVGATGPMIGTNSTLFSSIEGSVVMYEYKSTKWNRRGNPIVIKETNSSRSTMTGQAVALSSDGETIAVGGRQTSIVQVHTWNKDHWKQLGSDILHLDGDNSACFGCALSISRNGTIISIGAPQDSNVLFEAGSVWTFVWNENEWVKRGEELRGNSENDSFGHSVSLSSDASFVAVGGDHHRPSESFTSKVFSWDNFENGGKWKLTNGFIQGGFCNEVKLSADASSIAVSIFNEEKGNVLETTLYKKFDDSSFKLYMRSTSRSELFQDKRFVESVIAECRPGANDVLEIMITPDTNINETSWALLNETKYGAPPLVTVPNYAKYGETYKYTYCMNYETECVRFAIFDTACNGLCTTSSCLGNFKLKWNGKIIADKSEFGCQDSYIFGNLCDYYPS